MLNMRIYTFGMGRITHREEIRKRILAVSGELFLKQGYKKTSIRKIIDESGITIGSLYHFFKNKDDLLFHLAVDGFKDFVKISDNICGEKVVPRR